MQRKMKNRKMVYHRGVFPVNWPVGNSLLILKGNLFPEIPQPHTPSHRKCRNVLFSYQ